MQKCCWLLANVLYCNLPNTVAMEGDIGMGETLAISLQNHVIGEIMQHSTGACACATM